jgi:hypothetical protein
MVEHTGVSSFKTQQLCRWIPYYMKLDRERMASGKKVDKKKLID